MTTKLSKEGCTAVQHEVTHFILKLKPRWANEREPLRDISKHCMSHLSWRGRDVPPFRMNTSWIVTPDEARNESPTGQFEHKVSFLCWGESDAPWSAWSDNLLFEIVWQIRLGTRALECNLKTFYFTFELRREGCTAVMHKVTYYVWKMFASWGYEGEPYSAILNSWMSVLSWESETPSFHMK